MNPAEFTSLAQTEEKLWWFRGMRRILFSLLDPLAKSHKLEKVLEAGSGTGHMSRIMQSRYGWNMVPTDLAWEGVSRTPITRRISPVQADIAACPYADNAFDAVVSLDVLVHFPQGEEIRALSEFARVLRPGGLLVLRVSAMNILRSRHSIFTHERQRFSRPRLIEAVRRTGLESLRCTYANSLLMPVALTRFRIWEPLIRAKPASGTAPVPGWLDNLLYLPLAAEKLWIERGLNFPAGQSLLLIASKPA